MKNRGTHRIASLTLLFAVVGLAEPATGQVRWSQNGHVYQLIPTNPKLTWQQAKADAASRTFLGVPGHLVTINSEDEHDFLVANFALQECWIGAFQQPGSPEPAGGWAWITGEPFTFTAWAAGEPNNYYGGGFGPEVIGAPESVAHYVSSGQSWNDLPDSPYVTVRNYVVEFPPHQGYSQQTSFGCFGSHGRRPVLLAMSTPSIGSSFGMEVSDLPPAAVSPVIFALGQSGTTFAGFSLPLDLTGIGMPNCFLYTSIDVTVPSPVANNRASIAVTIPNVPGLIGASIHSQCFVVDPGANALGLILSGSMESIIGL